MLIARDAIPDGYELPVMFFCFGLVAATIFYSRWKNGSPNAEQRRSAIAIGGVAITLWIIFLLLLLL